MFLQLVYLATILSAMQLLQSLHNLFITLKIPLYESLCLSFFLLVYGFSGIEGFLSEVALPEGTSLSVAIRILKNRPQSQRLFRIFSTPFPTTCELQFSVFAVFT